MFSSRSPDSRTGVYGTWPHERSISRSAHRTAGMMHWAIYVGFIVLFLGTVTLEIDNLLPANLKFLEGGFCCFDRGRDVRSELDFRLRRAAGGTHHRTA